MEENLNTSNNYFSKTEYFVREKKHHLDASLYKGNHAIAFTVCIKERKPVFLDKQIFEVFESSLLKSLEANKCKAIVYLFMPDHCHILVRGKSPDSDMRKMIVSFKQFTGYWLSKNLPHASWQKDYYDHILRTEDDVNKQLGYILLNPIRKGIVENWYSYPFKGSTLFNFESWGKERSDFYRFKGLAG